jgi:hypothetical protein
VSKLINKGFSYLGSIGTVGVSGSALRKAMVRLDGSIKKGGEKRGLRLRGAISS